MSIWQCSENMWKCKDKSKCISSEDVCNGGRHCQDHSDEDLDVCAQWNCSQGLWKCKNNQCINMFEVCDGNKDCSDRSDEHSCHDWACLEGEWKCANNVSPSYIPR